jgi:hypothetical protein
LRPDFRHLLQDPQFRSGSHRTFRPRQASQALKRLESTPALEIYCRPGTVLFCQSGGRRLSGRLYLDGMQLGRRERRESHQQTHSVHIAVQGRDRNKHARMIHYGFGYKARIVEDALMVAHEATIEKLAEAVSMVSLDWYAAYLPDQNSTFGQCLEV